MRFLLMVALAIGPFTCAQGQSLPPPQPLPTVTVVGTTIDFVDVACMSTGCEEWLKMHGGLQELMMDTTLQPDAGQLDITKSQFCAKLASIRPSGCGNENIENPPSTPTTDVNWKPNGCGDGSIGVLLTEAAWLVTGGARLGGTSLNRPEAGIDFQSACDKHDWCYGSGFGKATCDLQFQSNMLQSCVNSWNPQCDDFAWAYYTAVDQGGNDAYSESIATLDCAKWSLDMRRNGCSP